MQDIPVVDLAASTSEAGALIDAACRSVGFFAVTGHGIEPNLLTQLRHAAVDFFALPSAVKSQISMARGGRAWRGWFPLGGELTSGMPDGKEGIYFGTELSTADPRVRAGVALHGPNLFPATPDTLRQLVLDTISGLTSVGERVLEAMAVGLGLDPSWFAKHLTKDPTVLFRIFRYPPAVPQRLDSDDRWGVREHTDYGLVTVLAHDGTPGLQVKTSDGWVDAPYLPESLIINVGDMLEKLTSGRYRSTPHRVRNQTSGDRYSFPLFLDPGWDTTVVSLPGSADDLRTNSGFNPVRWDDAAPLAWEGTYGDYLTSRVAKVFPDLFSAL